MKLNNIPKELIEKIQVFQDGKEYDPDSSPAAWRHFEKIYLNEFSSQFDLKNLVLKKNRLLAPSLTNSKELKNNNIEFVGGETDFNFNESNYEYYNKLIELEDCEEKRHNLQIQLENCRKNHHTLVNFSLMPITGGLKNFKGRGRDRLDKFLVSLDMYFKDKNRENIEDLLENDSDLVLSNYIIKFGLISYLKRFEDVQDYFKRIYFIQDKKLISDILANGEKEINTPDSLKEYMDLAQRFWNEKSQQIIKIKEKQK
ncbi:hypothetical protein [Lactococcus sp.]|uniref:hypothetical protein n=1 Tax=Lactococcus sp. TaxID=44273 RepID=UPI0035AF02E8